jgi:predicted transcriptional regulator
METIEGIRRGLADIKAGRSTSADEFFTEFFSKYDIPVEE